MNIVFVTMELSMSNNSVGGLGTFMANIARIFYLNGHKVRVLYASTKEENIVFDEGISVENLYIEKFMWDVYDDVSRIYHPENTEKAILNRRQLVYMKQAEMVKERLLKLNEMEKIDIVHFCNYHALSMFMKKEIPYTIRLSSIGSIYFNGAETPNGSVEYKDNKMPVTDFLERYTMDKIKNIVVPSKLLADMVKNEWNLNPTVIESPFYLYKAGWDDSVYENTLKGKKYIIFYARLCYLKGIAVIANIAERFLAKHPDMYFVFAGMDKEIVDANGNTVLASEFILKGAGCHKDRMLYMGALVREQIYPVIEHAELCLFPTRFDNLPNGCIEAMALGKIVVGTNGASIDQLIENGVSGILCERDNPDSFLEGIEKALSLSNEEKGAMIAKAKERVKDMHPDKIYQQYLEFYQKIIDEWEYE